MLITLKSVPGTNQY